QNEAASHQQRISKACARASHGHPPAKRARVSRRAFSRPLQLQNSIMGHHPAMPRLASNLVFTPTSYPTHTYVQRDELLHERLLEEGMRSSTQIASISGPSKAGKTVLVQRVVGEGNLITVSGASVRTADQLWERVLDWWGEPHATMASAAETTTD